MKTIDRLKHIAEVATHLAETGAAGLVHAVPRIINVAHLVQQDSGPLAQEVRAMLSHLLPPRLYGELFPAQDAAGLPVQATS